MSFKHTVGKFQTNNLEVQFGQYRQMSALLQYFSIQVLKSVKNLKTFSITLSWFIGFCSLVETTNCHSCDVTEIDFVSERFNVRTKHCLLSKIFL